MDGCIEGVAEMVAQAYDQVAGGTLETNLGEACFGGGGFGNSLLRERSQFGTLKQVCPHFEICRGRVLPAIAHPTSPGWIC